MNHLNLKSLFAKLDNHSKQALEAATAYCLSKQHPYVEIEHWLYKLIVAEQDTLKVVCDDLSMEHLIDDVMQSMESFKSVSQHTPALSGDLLDLTQEAWFVASVEFQQPRIHFVHLMIAMLTQHRLLQILLDISPEFKKLTLEALKAIAADTPIDTEQSVRTNESFDQYDKEALKKYTIDLTEQALSADPIIGRYEEIQSTIDCLLRKRQNNPILVAEPGVGKTALVEGIAQRIVLNEVPRILQDTKLLELDLGLLQSGSGVRGEFEQRLKSVIHAVREAKESIILFIDEAHMLIGAGNAPGQTDAANLLKPALARGELRVIAATTWLEYKKYIEQDPALSRRFQLIHIKEPSEEDAIKLMRGVVGHFAKHHQVDITDDATISAVKLSKQYIPNRHLPDKCISLMDTACARVAMSQQAKPIAIQKIEYEIKAIHDELHQIDPIHTSEKRIQTLQTEKKLHEDMLERLNQKWLDELAIVDQIRQQKNQADKAALSNISELKQSLKSIQQENPFVRTTVDADTIAEVVSDWTGIPTGKLVKSEIQNILELNHKLSKQIVGQPFAIEHISNSLKASYAHLSNPNKPLGVFLFLGLSGVGKTETALQLANAIYGGEQNLTTINMSEYKEPHKSALLLGAPPGYVGYGEGGVLTEAIRRNPFSLLLLDEFEKSHRSVHDIFLQIFDKGQVMDGQGRLISFKQSMIIMTSNIGAELLRDVDPSDCPSLESLRHMLEPTLLKHFKPEFLGRVQIIPFLPLDQSSYEKIIHLRLQKLKDQVHDRYEVDLVIDESVTMQMLEKCQYDTIGARYIEHFIHAEMLPKLSTTILEHLQTHDRMGHIRIHYQNGLVTSIDDVIEVEPASNLYALSASGTG